MVEPEQNVDMTTERQVLDLLGRRYSEKAGNGPRWTVAEHVRSDAGFDARRSCDFMAWDNWASSGLEVVGHEVKVSRADWLREVKHPEKAMEFMRFCDRWFLVAPPGIAKESELPAGWGLIEVGLGVLRVVVPAPRLTVEHRGGYRPGRDEWWVPRGFAFAFARAAARTAARPVESVAPILAA